MIRKFFSTKADPAAFLARLFLGLVMLPHGAQKAFGWFGGYGFEGTMGYFTGTLGIPWALAVLAIAAELLGSLGLIVGLGTRLAAAGIGITMAVAAVVVHLPVGFFMNWSGAASGEGFEFHLLAIGLALVLAIRGGGALSLDREIERRLS